MKANKFYFFLTLITLLVSVQAEAASVITRTKIVQLGYDKNHQDVLFIRTETWPADQLDKIACHTNPHWNFVLKLTTPFEEKMYSALLAAQASKQIITLKGSGL